MLAASTPWLHVIAPLRGRCRAQWPSRDAAGSIRRPAPGLSESRWIQPTGVQPREQIVQQDEFDRHAEIEDTHWWFVVRREIMLDQMLRFGANGNLLEIGCGTGGNLRRFGRVFARCSGVEIDPVAVAHARRLGSGEVLQGDFRELLEGRWGEFGWVVLADVIEHVEDDARFVGDLWQRIERGTRVLVTVPSADLPMSAHDRALGHHRRYSAERLREPFDACGARVHFESGFNRVLLPLIRLLRDRQGERASDLQRHGALTNTLLRTAFGLERGRLRGGIGMRSGVSRLLVVEKT